jgi:hypothetical protein
MSCKNCKEKKDLYNELYEQTEGVPTFVIWIVITLVVFACYGVYSLISKFL